MSDADADAFILTDVARGNVGGEFRWTGERPRFRLWPDEREDRELYMRFGIIPATFKETGPVTIEISINGTRLAERTFDLPRDYDHSERIPAGLLGSDVSATVELHITPVYKAPPYGEKLGICLYAIGFRKIQQ